MSIRPSYELTESQRFVAGHLTAFTADPGQFFQDQFAQLSRDPIGYVVTVQDHYNKSRLDNFSMLADKLLEGISSFAASIDDASRRVIPLPQEISSGSVCPLERVMGITQIGLAGASAVGVVGVLAGSIVAIPAVVGLSATLAIGSALGVHAAGTAVSLSRRVEDEEARRRQIETLTKQTATLEQANQSFSQQISALSIENSTLRQTGQELRRQLAELTDNVDRLERENTSLNENLKRLEESILQFSVQNAHYKKIAEDFSGYLQSFGTATSELREGLNGKIAEFAGQIIAAHELWNKVRQDTNIFRQGYDEQIAQLSSLILQLTDPKHTLLRLEEHRAIQQQIERTSSMLASYQSNLDCVIMQLAHKQGELEARNQLLIDLESAHRQILQEYGSQNTVHAASIAELSRILSGFREQKISTSSSGM